MRTGMSVDDGVHVASAAPAPISSKHQIVRKTTIFPSTAAEKEIDEHVFTCMPDNERKPYQGTTNLSHDEIEVMRWKAMGLAGKPMTGYEKGIHAQKRAAARAQQEMHKAVVEDDPSKMTPDELLAAKLKLCRSAEERQAVLDDYARQHGALAAKEAALRPPETGPMPWHHFARAMADLVKGAREERVPDLEVQDAKDGLIERLEPASIGPDDEALVLAIADGLMSRRVVTPKQRLAIIERIPKTAGTGLAKAE